MNSVRVVCPHHINMASVPAVSKTFMQCVFSSVTVVATSRMVHESLKAAQILAEENIDLEVIDGQLQVRKRCGPINRSMSRPNIHSPNMLKKIWPRFALL